MIIDIDITLFWEGFLKKIFSILIMYQVILITAQLK